MTMYCMKVDLVAMCGTVLNPKKSGDPSHKKSTF